MNHLVNLLKSSYLSTVIKCCLVLTVMGYGAIGDQKIYAQGLNAWGHAQTTDMDQSWGRGPQMTFSNPAGIVAYQGWGFSYDVQAFNRKPAYASAHLHQLALSTPLWGAYQSSFGVQTSYVSSGSSEQIPTLWTSAHALDFKTFRLGFALQGWSNPQFAPYTLSAHPMNDQKYIRQREQDINYILGIQWSATSWLTLSSVWHHLNAYYSRLGDYRFGLALRPWRNWILGGQVRPFSQGVAWNTHTQIRMWKGLALELSYQNQPSPSHLFQSAVNSTHMLSLALTWLGNIGWRVGAIQQHNEQSYSGYQLGLRFNSRVPQEYQALSLPKTVVLPLNQLVEVRDANSLWKSTQQTHPFLDTLLRLQDITTQKDVHAVFLVMGPNTLGWAQAEELGQAIWHLRRAGKWVYFFGHELNQVQYAVASQADSIWVAPTSSINLSGFLKEQLHFKGLLDRLQIKAEFLTVGDYKSAPELFTHTAPSQPAQKVMNQLLDQKYSFLTQHLRARYRQQSWYKTQKKIDWQQRRGMLHVPIAMNALNKKKFHENWKKTAEFQQIKAWLDQGPYQAQQAKKAGLVDVVVPAVHLEKELKGKQYGRYTRLSRDQVSSTDLWPAHESIAVIHCIGDIGGGLIPILPGQKITAQSTIPLIKKVITQSHIKGVVIRIDSPGGSVSDADEIWQAVKDLRKYKPVAISMGNIAASGGYYIASAGHRIFASAATLTGSIGVFAGKVDVSQAMESLGINIHRQRKGKGGGSLSILTPWDQEQKKHLQQSIEQIYELFLTRILSGRKKMKRDQLEKLAAGRVWTGLEAYQNGLVDEIGGILDAIEWVRKKARLAKNSYKLEQFSIKKPSLLQKVTRGVMGASSSADSASITQTSHTHSHMKDAHKVWNQLQKLPQWQLISQMPNLSTMWMQLLNLLIHYPSQALVYAPITMQ